MEQRAPRLTFKDDLPGGQNRLRELILYVAQRCERATRFGAIKLNKILWKADFDSFAARQIPVTGRLYKRQRLGPVPGEMLPLRRDMEKKGLIRIEQVELGDGIVEHRTIALVEPDLHLFTPEDIGFVDASIRHYWAMTGMEASDESHGVAWETRSDGDPMPYEAAFLSDRPLTPGQRQRLARRIFDEGWISE
jgi:hypothetical protein